MIDTFLNMRHWFQAKSLEPRDYQITIECRHDRAKYKLLAAMHYDVALQATCLRQEPRIGLSSDPMARGAIADIPYRIIG